jgi:hypothetical protein
MEPYTKAQRKRLRRLRDIAYERELDQELEKLYQNFHKWHNKEIDGFELNELIHGHHQGASRELWKFYMNADPDTAVARAVKMGLFEAEEIQGDVLELVSHRFNLFSNDDES